MRAGSTGPTGCRSGAARAGGDRNHLLEEVTHGWDLATATGQDRGFDPEAVQVVSELVCGSMSGERPPGMPFRAAPGDAMPLNQLAALFGRRR